MHMSNSASKKTKINKNHNKQKMFRIGISVVIVGGIDQQWQMDLADMQSLQKFNDGYRYLLVCIESS